jgi:hypothetical protein
VSAYNPKVRRDNLLRAEKSGYGEHTTQEALLVEIALALTDIAESLREGK